MKNGMEGLATSYDWPGLYSSLFYGASRLGSPDPVLFHIPLSNRLYNRYRSDHFIGQIKDSWDFTFRESPVETMEKLGQFISCMDTPEPSEALVGSLSLAIHSSGPGFFKKVPPSFIAVVAAAVLLVKGMGLRVNTHRGILYTFPRPSRVPSAEYQLQPGYRR